MSNTKYFEVIAKCGHVGKEYYYEGHFFVTANSRKSAAQSVKHFARVKKDHQDVILDVISITEEQYDKGYEEQRKNPYFHCGSVQQQSEYWNEISQWIRPETEYQLNYRAEHSYDYKKYPERISNRGIRNIYKYTKYNSFPVTREAFAY